MARTDTDVSDALNARLSSLGAVHSTGWSAAPRRAALARLRAMGVPSKRDEYWRYTDPAPFTSAAETAAQSDASASGKAELAGVLDAVDALRLVFIDGHLAREHCDDLALEGVEITALAQSQDADIHWARGLYGTLEEAGQNPVKRPLAALCSAYARDGALIRVTGKAARPIALVYKSSAAGTETLIHHCIRLEEGAELTLLEEGHIGARAITTLECDLADNARFNHVRVQGPENCAPLNTHLFTRLGAQASCKSFTLNAHNGLVRNDAVAHLTGSSSVVHLAAAALTRNGAHHDDTVFITHDAEGCESRQVFKKMLDGAATSVFQGKILVHPHAQKTDGYQISQGLLLDDDSQFLAKPELEIYADDVKCSHGSTSGALNETALFYLQSRGVPYAEARDLLVLAFLAQVFEEIEDTGLAEIIHARLELWLARKNVAGQ